MKIPKIVFIDDGISGAFIGGNQKFENYIADSEVTLVDVFENRFSHATLCYRIFQDHIKVPYHLISIKVLDSATGNGNKLALLTALNWCIGKDIDLIHMSIGTSQYSDFTYLCGVVSRLVKDSRVVIVASSNNQNTLTLPACLPEVIGVRHCSIRNLQGAFAYNPLPYDQIEVLTCVNNLPIYYGGRDFVRHGSNSLAVPYIAACICGYIAQGIDGLENIRYKLACDATGDHSIMNYEFYKTLLSKWENISVPIVAIPDDLSEQSTQLKKLILEFVHKEYRAIGLSYTHKTSVPEFIFNINKLKQECLSSLIELYYNFTLPDIIFLHMDLRAIKSLPEHLQPDLFLLPSTIYDAFNQDECSIRYLDDPDLCENIMDLF